MKRYRAIGFSLIELIVTLAVMAIVTSIAAPSFAMLVKTSRLSSSRDQVLMLMHHARTHAISLRQDVIFCAGSSSAGCTSQWRDGAVVFVDRNRNRRMDGTEQLLAALSPDELSEARISGNRPLTRFDALGRAGGTNQTIRVCIDQGAGLTVVVANSGRLRSGKGSCS
jgi:type IV fimbrial biogenesis protein FimT